MGVEYPLGRGHRLGPARPARVHLAHGPGSGGGDHRRGPVSASGRHLDPGGDRAARVGALRSERPPVARAQSSRMGHRRAPLHRRDRKGLTHGRWDQRTIRGCSRRRPGSSGFTVYRDDEAEPPTLICQVGSTRLSYRARAIEDLRAWLREQGDWVPLGAADEQKPAAEGTVEAWGRSPDNPVGGWYGLRKGYRGRFGLYLPPLLEALGLAGAHPTRRTQQPDAGAVMARQTTVRSTHTRDSPRRPPRISGSSARCSPNSRPRTSRGPALYGFSTG